MPRYQDSGHNGQHAFTAFIHSNSPFVRFSLAFHSDPAQYLKTSQPALARRVKARVGRNEAEEVGGSGGGNGDDARLQIGRRVGPSPAFSGKVWAHGLNIVRTMYHISDKLRSSDIFVRCMLHCSDK
jgi:hypothetical protein